MTWENESEILNQFREQHKLCPTIISNGWNLDSRFHNPSAVITGDDIDVMPWWVLSDIDQDRDRYAEGAVGLIHGVLTSTLSVDVVTCPTITSIEVLARKIMKDMASQFFGIAFSRFAIGMCSDLHPGQRAEGENTPQADFRKITTTYQFGLNR